MLAVDFIPSRRYPRRSLDQLAGAYCRNTTTMARVCTTDWLSSFKMGRRYPKSEYRDCVQIDFMDFAGYNRCWFWLYLGLRLSS